MKKIILSLMVTVLIIPAFMLVAASNVSATEADEILWDGQKDDIVDALELGDQDPRVMAANVINVLLGFLGIIAVVIILLGGFKWMTAGGNEDGIEEAKKLMSAGVIGLIIILASWAIASFVVDTVYNATTGIE